MTQQQKQGYFDKVWDWFVVQRKPPGFSEDGVCVYNGTNDEQCAFAVIVPDELRPQLLEGKSAKTLMGFSPLCTDLAFAKVLKDAMGVHTEKDADYVAALQYAHDDSAKETASGEIRKEFLYEFRDRLLGIARSYELAVPGE